ncbi:hypothetical protein MYOV011v1_p0389 [Vibrio phage 6E35.1a]|nr:hypothetical protein MYOV011v1_p0389 [Vibrio phage 6E35.1a]
MNTEVQGWIDELNALYARGRADDYQFVQADATLHQELYYKVVAAAVAESFPMTMVQTEKLDRYNILVDVYSRSGPQPYSADNEVTVAQRELMRSLGVDTRG